MAFRVISTVSAVTLSLYISVNPAYAETQIELSSGYRVDDLKWNIAGDINGQNPNIASELTWSDLGIRQAKADIRVIEQGKYYVRASLGHGRIYKGKNQDSDYAGNDRTNEFSRSDNDAGNGKVSDATLGLGYCFKLEDGPTIIAVIGYAYHSQNVRITNGYSTIPATGAFSGLDSSFAAQWKGPWAGVDVLLVTSGNARLSGEFEYHRTNYAAEADWNRRTDLMHPVSFTQHADGTGTAISLNGEYLLTRQWAVTAKIGFQDRLTRAGIHRFYFADGTTFDTRLNEVHWRTRAIMFGARYLF